MIVVCWTIGGNAGLAAAYSARKLGVSCTVVVPGTTPAFMVERLREERAVVEICGDVGNKWLPVLFNNSYYYSLRWRWVAVHICRRCKVKIHNLHRHWGEWCYFILAYTTQVEKIAAKTTLSVTINWKIIDFYGFAKCLMLAGEYNNNCVITPMPANQCVPKALFTCRVCTKKNYY